MALSIQILHKYLNKPAAVTDGIIRLEGTLRYNKKVGYHVSGKNGAWILNPGRRLKLEVGGQPYYLSKMVC